MPKVYISSMRFKHDPETGEAHPLVDISSAAKYGEITYLTTPGNTKISQSKIQDIAEKMRDSSPEDFILLTGDIFLTSVAISEFGLTHGFVKILRWDRRELSYKVEDWYWPIEDEESV